MLNVFHNTSKLLKRQIELYPHHEKFLNRRFEGLHDVERVQCEALATDIIKLAADNLDDYCLGYDFFCTIQRKEEIHFRRTQQYRLTTFKEAFETVYSDKAFMTKYMHGLLLTQVYWTNHTGSIGFYERHFLANLKIGQKLLEIGPGHGLLFARACQKLGSQNSSAWDISEASLEDTARSLNALEIRPGYRLAANDLFAASAETFDAVVFSEVLEHVEQPNAAMQALRHLLKPAGRLYINVPLNSPAPDHLFLLRSPDELEKFVTDCGFEIIDRAYFPATNYSMESAIRHSLTISACLIVKPQ
jgi:2-polyprenyl-3-methyl-5-hydroxy-6-metoxy-1,4-benzoquinol methylase